MALRRELCAFYATLLKGFCSAHRHSNRVLPGETESMLAGPCRGVVLFSFPWLWGPCWTELCPDPQLPLQRTEAVN